ncbi:hypothetical protein RJ639_021026 [Escallonia herrerae]|uniref:Amine oxidase domain-containing protein n=1 Tax=Escallonia herrerae TaxID=1293975 RepID=A0AA88V6K4_9ASTE|nr:hypothetical protein RJ639_021026 [Escallonia herrerae]
MEIKGSISADFVDGTFVSCIERNRKSPSSVIVIGGGISGIAAARILRNASFEKYLIDDFVLALSYMLFDMDGHQVPQQMVIEVGDAFKRILKEEHVLSGGHGLMVQGYYPVIKALAKDIDIRLNHRVTRVASGCGEVMVTLEDGRNFVADAAIITVPIGVLKANLIEFEPKLPEWKVAAISDLGVGNENKIALQFDKVFWPNVELLGTVAPRSYACGYFLNLHKATGHPVLVYMAAGRFAYDLEKQSDESAVNFVMLQLKKMFPDASEPLYREQYKIANAEVLSCLVGHCVQVQYLFSRWGTDPDSLGCYSYDLVGKPADVYDRLRAPVGNLFFGGEAVSMENQGSVHGAYSSGVTAAENCRRHLVERRGSLEKIQLVSFRDEILEATVPLQISRILFAKAQRGANCDTWSPDMLLNEQNVTTEIGHLEIESGDDVTMHDVLITTVAKSTLGRKKGEMHLETATMAKSAEELSPDKRPFVPS